MAAGTGAAAGQGNEGEASGESRLLGAEHPDHPGWRQWIVPGEGRYNHLVLEPLLVRREAGSNSARLRMLVDTRHLNMNGTIHGGVILSLIDVALFACTSVVLGKALERGVTVELSTQFVGAGDPERPLDAVLEVVRETGRLVFARGLAVQGDDTVASFTGLLRKIRAS